MKTIKRVYVIILALVLCSVSFLFCCKNKEKVIIKYYASASELLPLLKSGKLDTGILPEPACTKLQTIDSANSWYVLDMQELYDSELKSYPQAVVMVKESLLNTYSDIDELLSSGIEDNVLWAKNNIESAVNAINSHLFSGLVNSLDSNTLTASVIDNCKIYFKSASDSVDYVNNYIESILSVSNSTLTPPAKRVNSDFFYNKSANGQFNKQEINVIVPDGAPALSMAKYMNTNYNFNTEKQVNYTVVNSNNLGNYITNKSGDIIVMPLNLATKLYNANSTENYKMVGVITHGNSYIVSRENISLSDLSGKEIGVIGEGLIMDLTFKAILKNNGLNY